ncbi:type VI secretion system secreted protein Hcp [Gibbsiella quercinecans]|uniref:Hcp1 family type VI secretion system effector n=1 Tax=Gibbsiella quercinecans TaxID=929813 RepID=A0A250B7Q2_9GAMM|nr:type VI secretion system tube protein TssD [Gibbsiella quercinecans]ATA22106.1 Hcp1 family type VI secretion system effector [Gibbsiella quercinecans]RLM04534.1 Hcp1 family type VI secretion system effector [Gibbsiella quercinecans]TCT87999.1 type VI secretion system secreted protein Hcp [Gibbsiella quercinecans]
MSNPAYLWLTDTNGSPVVGGSLVADRIGAIELKSFTHNVCIPTDSSTGRLTGTRVHAPIMFQKEFDRVTPILYKTLSEGATLKSATIKMYSVSEAGLETEYFNIILDNVKITSITPDLYPGAASGTHLETILLRYESITWKHCDGNIIYKDSWNHRITA